MNCLSVIKPDVVGLLSQDAVSQASLYAIGNSAGKKFTHSRIVFLFIFHLSSTVGEIVFFLKYDFPLYKI